MNNLNSMRGDNFEYDVLLLVEQVSCQILTALQHIHSFKIIHRDLKGQNILIKGKGRDIIAVISDFGSAKIHSSSPSTWYVSTRYYRAPECILQNGFYNHKIDIWGFGAVLAECLLGKPIFKGVDSTDQLCKIFRILGFPDKECLSTLNTDLNPDHVRSLMQKQHKNKLV